MKRAPILLILTTVAGAIALDISTAGAQTKLRLECQRNLSDGRTLVTDDRRIPEGSGFKVLSFEARRTESGWSYGPCEVVLRPLRGSGTR